MSKMVINEAWNCLRSMNFTDRITVAAYFLSWKKKKAREPQRKHSKFIHRGNTVNFLVDIYVKKRYNTVNYMA